MVAYQWSTLFRQVCRTFLASLQLAADGNVRIFTGFALVRHDSCFKWALTLIDYVPNLWLDLMLPVEFIGVLVAEAGPGTISQDIQLTCLNSEVRHLVAFLCRSKIET